MAKGDMDDFLKLYYRRLHTDAMPDSVLDQLVEDKKKGLLTGHQQEWFKDFLEEYQDADGNTKYRAKALPELKDTSELHEDELIKLYKRLAIVMAAMKNASIFYDSVNDANASAFVKHWVDDLQIFPIPKATNECKNGIEKIIFLTTQSPQRDNINQIIADEVKDDKGKAVFKDTAAVEKFINEKCISKDKYNSDTSVQEKLRKIAYTLISTWRNARDNDVTANAIGRYIEDIQPVSLDKGFSVIDVDPNKLNDFRDIYGSQILSELYNDKSVRAKFADKDKSGFVEIIEKAEKKISWHDKNSNDYVEPKIEDSLNPVQWIEKQVKDTYNDTLKKYEELRGGHLFFGPHAKEICKAIDKEGIKPADGLPGLLDKAAAVKKRLTNKTLAEHFDWFTETMGALKDKIPKAIEGCWKDAKQMKCVIEQIILKATDPNDKANLKSNMEKAKTAMEIMTVMKYGMMTSKIMDAMKKTDFNIFSDGKLSWNKNEGIQFVTKAFDQSVKAAFLGVGYGITFARNKIMMRNMEFTDKNNSGGPLANRFSYWKNTIAKSGSQEKKDLGNIIANKQTELAQKEQDKTKLGNETVNVGGRVLHYNDNDIGDIRTHKSDLEAQLKPYKDAKENAAADMEKQQKAKEKSLATKERLQERKDEYDELNKLINDEDIKEKIDALTAERDSLHQQVNDIRDALSAPELQDPNGNPITDPEDQKSYRGILLADMGDLRKQIQQINKSINDEKAKIHSPERAQLKANAQNRLNDPEFKADLASYNQAVTDYKNADTAYNTAQNNYNNANTEYEQQAKNLGYTDVSEKITQFENATKEIDELNKNIKQKQDALNNWDSEHVNAVLELENYWNFLQSGDVKTWRLRLGNAQKKFDENGNKLALYQNYVSQHGLAA